MKKATQRSLCAWEEDAGDEQGAQAGAEQTLDPEDWESFRALAHRALDDVLLDLATLREQPAARPLPSEVRAALSTEPLPRAGEPLADVYREYVTNILPYIASNRHPRAWGWVRGAGTPVGLLAEMLTAGANAHVGGGSSAPVLVEAQVLRWLAQALGMPGETSGLLTSGATMANLLGLAVARHARAGFPVREEGLAGRPGMIVYCSRETHFWARKAVELMGFGRQSLREIKVDDDYRMDVRALAERVARDREDGLQPVAVIANAGTVNTGAIDDLPSLRRLCDAHGLWLHVDGAFGALLKLSAADAPLVAGLETADSVGLDLHKWLSVPFEAGCLLVRDAKQHRAAFATAAAYLEPEGVDAISFADRGVEGSRSFKALKVWMSLKTFGLDKLGAMVRQNVAQARYFAELVEADPELALLAPCPTNVVCFAYVPRRAGAFHARSHEALQRAILERIRQTGEFSFSGTTLHTAHGQRYALRIAVVNHRSCRQDFEALAVAVRAAGRALCGEEFSFFA